MGVYADCAARGLLPKEVFWPVEGDDAEPCSPTEESGTRLGAVGFAAAMAICCTSLVMQLCALTAKWKQYGKQKRKNNYWTLVRAIPNVCFTALAGLFQIQLFTRQVRLLQDLLLSLNVSLAFSMLYITTYFGFYKFVRYHKKIKLRTATLPNFSSLQGGGKILKYDPLGLLKVWLCMNLLSSTSCLWGNLWLVEFGASDTRTPLAVFFCFQVYACIVPLLAFVFFSAIPTLKDIASVVEYQRNSGQPSKYFEATYKTFAFTISLWAAVLLASVMVGATTVFVRPLFLKIVPLIEIYLIATMLATLLPATSYLVKDHFRKSDIRSRLSGKSDAPAPPAVNPHSTTLVATNALS